jgi:hypothetical protein
LPVLPSKSIRLKSVAPESAVVGIDEVRLARVAGSPGEAGRRVLGQRGGARILHARLELHGHLRRSAHAAGQGRDRRHSALVLVGGEGAVREATDEAVVHREADLRGDVARRAALEDAHGPVGERGGRLSGLDEQLLVRGLDGDGLQPRERHVAAVVPAAVRRVTRAAASASFASSGGQQQHREGRGEKSGNAHAAHCGPEKEEADNPSDIREIAGLRRAADRVRTGDPELGKLVLYQLSYHRVTSSLKVGAWTRLVNEK